VFLTPAFSVAAGACSPLVTLALQGPGGSLLTPEDDLVITLTSPGGDRVAFNAAADCADWTATSVVLPRGQSTASFRVRALTVGTPTVVAQAPDLEPVSQVITVTPGALSGFLAEGIPGVLVAGACSDPISVTALDAYGNVVVVAEDTPVLVTRKSESLVDLHVHETCEDVSAPLFLGPGTSRVTFRLRTFQAGVADELQVRVGGAAQDTFLDVTPAPPSRLSFTTDPPTMAAGSCSAPATLRVTDAWGNTSPAVEAVSLSLSQTPELGLRFRGDPFCLTDITALDLLPGHTTVTVRYVGTLVGTTTVSVFSRGLAAATQDVTVTPDAPSKLSFDVALLPVPAGKCSGPLEVWFLDRFNNLAPAGSSRTVQLAGPLELKFYGEETCEAERSSLAVRATASTTGPFWFKTTAAGTARITASTAGLTTAILDQAVVPAPPTVLVLTDIPAFIDQMELVDALVHTRDRYGNASPVQTALTVSLVSTPAARLQFTPTAPVVPVGQSVATFQLVGSTLGTATVTAQATGYTSGTFTVSVALP
jgi:hypothetical protein